MLHVLHKRRLASAEKKKIERKRNNEKGQDKKRIGI